MGHQHPGSTLQAVSVQDTSMARAATAKPWPKQTCLCPAPTPPQPPGQLTLLGHQLEVGGGALLLLSARIVHLDAGKARPQNTQLAGCAEAPLSRSSGTASLQAASHRLCCGRTLFHWLAAGSRLAAAKCCGEGRGSRGAIATGAGPLGWRSAVLRQVHSRARH